VVAHRTLIVRKLKGLEAFIPYTSVHWEMLEKGTDDYWLWAIESSADHRKAGGSRSQMRKSQEIT